MKTEIINPEQLLTLIKTPVVDRRFPECCSDIQGNGIIHICNFENDVNDFCSLFGEDLEMTDLGYRHERCQKCLDNFKVKV